MKNEEMDLFERLLQRTLRVPTTASNPGDGSVVARQLDGALMKNGFKLSVDLLRHLSSIHPVAAKDVSVRIMNAARKLIGSHVKHNVYFKEFPNNVPDTMEFWVECIQDALLNPKSASNIAAQLSTGIVNLLDLPKYGKYLHTYEEMLAAHEEFVPLVKGKFTILHLGKSLGEEATKLYPSFATSSIPLNDSDKEFLQVLAKLCASDPQPEKIPVRENRAIINQVRLENSQPLLVDTATDILRLACSLSGGDVSLQEKTKFKSFSRPVRRALLNELNSVIGKNTAKLADVNQYREPWKRLGEKLHPHEAKSCEFANDVFAVARRDKKTLSIAAQVEVAFAKKDIKNAIAVLTKAPGYLFRSLDRLLVAAKKTDGLFDAVGSTIGKVSSRVILSVREHFQNRINKAKKRIFSNSKGKAWVTDETRSPFNGDVVSQLFEIFDDELSRRIPEINHLYVDPAIFTVAVPTSDKQKSDGFSIVPRGSVLPVTGKVLRFFMYWKQKSERTDYDLSVLFLNEKFETVGYSSYTSLRGAAYKHSGDITSAPNGASEFIDVELDTIENCSYIVPQVNVFCGEGFNDVEESFFGYMERNPKEKGQPYEPTTVRMKSDLRGVGQVALPLVLSKNDDGAWEAKWMHLFLTGRPNFNRVEGNKISSTLLAQTVYNRDYLSMEYLVELMRLKAKQFEPYVEPHPANWPSSPVTFVGLSVPEGLPEGSKVYTLSNLHELITLLQDPKK